MKKICVFLVLFIVLFVCTACDDEFGIKIIEGYIYVIIPNQEDSNIDVEISCQIADPSSDWGMEWKSKMDLVEDVDAKQASLKEFYVESEFFKKAVASLKETESLYEGGIGGTDIESRKNLKIFMSLSIDGEVYEGLSTILYVEATGGGDFTLYNRSDASKSVKGFYIYKLNRSI